MSSPPRSLNSQTGGNDWRTIAVVSYVADMSSDVMRNTEPIISCILSNNTQLNSVAVRSSSKTDISRGRPRKPYWPCNRVLFWTEICSRYLQKLHLPYNFCFASWPLSVFSVTNSTWKIDRRFKKWYVCESRVLGQPIFCRHFKLRASITLKSFISFSDITEAKQNLWEAL